MASAKRKTTPIANSEVQLKLLYSEDSLTKYWTSSLFNSVYLRHDIAEKHSDWENEDTVEFQNFMSTLRDIVAEYKNREKELNNWSETETINNSIKHILHALGWTNNCSGVQNPYLEETSFRFKNKTYRTDILIVDHPKEKQYINQAKGDDKLVEARQSVIMPVEVKYWNRLEEFRQGLKEEKKRTDGEIDDIERTASPNQQIVQYMDILKKQWGILTDGARWRLFNHDLSTEDVDRYYEFNFYSLFQAMSTEQTESDSREVTEAAKYFFHFFSKYAFYPKNGGEPFVDEVLNYSRKYVNKVEEDLKDRFVKAMNIACNAIFKAARSQGNTLELATIRNIAESALFNILFIKSLESRGILPMASTDYKKISLSSIIDKIERFDPEKDEFLNCRELERAFAKGNGNSFKYEAKGDELHDRILRLTGVIHSGASSKDNFGFEIAGFKESIFANDEWKAFKTFKITNHEWVRILFELGYAESESKNRKYQQIPYSYFTPRQLGSIYESFLEFKIEKAKEQMVYEGKQWIPADVESRKYKFSDIPKVRAGELFFTPDNEDRKATGSYYTPHYVVQYIIENTVGPQVSKLTANELLKFKLIDPAMGSGHFLNYAVVFLANEYLRKLEKETKGDLDINVVEAKRRIMPNCIHGVDINSRAVKLAKMSLWLSTAAPGLVLEHLDDQLKTADTLGDSFKWKNEFPEVFSRGGFDAVIGNPPYRRELDFKHLFDEIAKTKIGKEFRSARMDLWYYFVHKGIEILKDDGQLSFITNAYWTAGSGAEKLIEQMKNETNVSEFVVLGNTKVFDDVSGQHMIFRIRKNADSAETVIKTVEENDKGSAEKYFSNGEYFKVFTKTKDSIFKNGKIDLEESNDDLLNLIEGGTELKDLGTIRQGIAENPSTIGRKVNEKHKNKWKTGEGVFALTPSEVKNLKLSGAEKSLLRNYHDLCDIGRFWTSEVPSRQLIYSTKETCEDIGKYPTLKQHLARFRTLMDGRRETINGSNEWFHLHWPRDEKIWKAKRKILSVQMGKLPTFASVVGDCYVPFSVNVFVPDDKVKLDIEYFEAVLNSRLMQEWFQHNAKKRGVGLEINGNVLQRAPIKVLDLDKKSDRELHDQIVSKTKAIKKKVGLLKTKEMDSESIELELVEPLSELEKLICKAYKVSYESLPVRNKVKDKPLGKKSLRAA